MKKGLVLGIIALFIISAVSPMVIGYTSNTVKDVERDEFLDKLAYLSYSNYDNSAKSEYYKEKLLNDYSNDDIDVVEEDIVQPVEPSLITSSGGPMDSPWPMMLHDVHHTGRSPYNTSHITDFEKWRFPGHVMEGGTAIDKNGTVYIGAYTRNFGDYLYAIYPNGTMKWKYEAQGFIQTIPAIAEDGTIYFGTDSISSNYFYAIDSNGNLKWSRQAGRGVQSSPAIGDDGTVYFGDWSDRINAYYPNGTIKWQYKTGNPVLSSPALYNDMVFCGSCDYYFYALYQSNGTLKWKLETGYDVRVSPCIGDDGTVYFVSRDSYLYSVYPNNGTIKWKTDVGAGTHPTIDKNGIIYAGWDKLYAVYSENGTIKWTFNPGNMRCIEGGAPVTSADGTIYFCTRIRELAGGEIIALHNNGTEKWRKKICNTYIDCGLAIAEDGTVYARSTCEWGGYLHAFGPVESNSPPETPTISGKTNGKVGERYWYTLRAVDPDKNPIRFYIDWGDGTHTGWTSERASGENCYYEHTWSELGSYTIRAKTKDILGEESDWGTLEVAVFPEQIIDKPVRGLYFMNLRIRRYLFDERTAIIIGPIKVEIDPTITASWIDKVEFYIDGELRETDTSWPFTWTWKEISFSKHVIKATVYANNGINESRGIEVQKFF